MKRYFAFLKKIALWCLGLFIVYQAVRIFVIEATLPSPKEGAEVFVSHFREMYVIFLPKYKMITMVRYDDSAVLCAQLLDQTNRAGRKIVGDFYYLEDRYALIDIFPFVPAPEGYTPYNYEMEVLSTLGEENKHCGDILLPTGTIIEAVIHRKGDRLITDRYRGALFDEQFYYRDSHTLFFREENPDLNYISRLYQALEAKMEK